MTSAIPMYCANEYVLGARAGSSDNPSRLSVMRLMTTMRRTRRVSLLVQRLQRALRQRRADCGFLYAQLDVVRDLQLDEIVFDFRNLADDPTCGHDFVAFGQAADQRLMFLTAFALRAPQQEIEDADETHQQQQIHVAGTRCCCTYVRRVHGGVKQIHPGSSNRFAGTRRGCEMYPFRWTRANDASVSGSSGGC